MIGAQLVFWDWCSGVLTSQGVMIEELEEELHWYAKQQGLGFFHLSHWKCSDLCLARKKEQIFLLALGEAVHVPL